MRIHSKIAAASVVAGLLVGLAPAMSAAAATPSAVPISALPDCGTSSPSGGWSLRDFLATDSSLENDLEARARLLRLGEPCESSGRVGIPYSITEAATDGDWEVGGAPSGGSGPTSGVIQGTRVCKISDPSQCMQYLGEVVWPNNPTQKIQCWNFSGGGDFQWKQSPNIGITSVSTSKYYFSAFGGLWGNSCTAAYPTTNGLVANEDRVPTSYWITDNSGVELSQLGGPLSSGPTTLGGKEPSEAIFGVTVELANGGGYGALTCYTSSDSQGVSTVPISNQAGFDSETPATMNDPENFSASFSSVFDPAPSSSCTYLGRIVLHVCVFVSPGGPTAYSCVTTEWNYSQYRNQTSYDGTTTEEQACLLAGQDSEGCNKYLYPENYDWSDPAVACGNPPAVSFTFDGSQSLGAWIGFWAKCLFVPAGGWDSHRWLEKAWEGSGVNELGTLTSTFADSMTYGESCGVVVDAGGTAVPIVINTCTWSWASSMHALLSWAIVLGFGGWVLYFVIANVLGIVNKKSVNPAESAGKD